MTVRKIVVLRFNGKYLVKNILAAKIMANLIGNGKVVLEVYKQGCPYCARIEPKVRELADRYRNAGVRFAQIDVMSYPNEVAELRSMSGQMIDHYPTFLFYNNGQLVNSYADSSSQRLEDATNWLYQL